MLHLRLFLVLLETFQEFWRLQDENTYFYVLSVLNPVPKHSRVVSVTVALHNQTLNFKGWSIQTYCLYC